PDETPRPTPEQCPAKEPVPMKVERLANAGPGGSGEGQLRIIAPAEVDNGHAIFADRAEHLAQFVLLEGDAEIEGGRMPTDEGCRRFETRHIKVAKDLGGLSDVIDVTRPVQNVGRVDSLLRPR